MTLGSRLTAAVCGLAAFLAISVSANAATWDFHLSGDTGAAYTYPGDVGISYIDLTDTDTGSGFLAGRTVSSGDTINLDLTLNNAVTVHEYDLGILKTHQPASATEFGSGFNYDIIYTYYLGGAVVPGPIGAPLSYYVIGSSGLMSFGAGLDPGSFSFDRLVINAVISSMFDADGNTITSMMTGGFNPYMGLYQAGWHTSPVPVPATLPLLATALGGIGFAAWRRRKANA